MIIRRFEPGDAQAVSDLIVTTIRVSNTKDYPPELMEELILHQQPADVMQRASWTHFYVAEEERRVIGCGAIGPYWGKEDESSLFTVFVLPDCQGKGVGRQIVETLEKDEYARRARRIEIPASITGLPFYLKMGYGFKDGKNQPDEEGLYRLEKFGRPFIMADRQLTRLDRVRALLDGIIKGIPSEEDKRGAYVHLYGVGLLASLLALKRGMSRETAEMACVAGMLHDLLTYVDRASDTDDHAHTCAEYAQENVLDRLDCFTDEEKAAIRHGIYNHSDKQVKGCDFDELIKDADAAQHALRNPMEDFFFQKERIQQALRELTDRK